MADEPIVQAGEVSKETPSQEKTPQPLTEDRVQAMIVEAVKQATEKGKDIGKREMQAIKDREVAKLQQKYKEDSGSFKDILGSLDPDVASQVELNLLRKQEKARSEREVEEQRIQQFQEAVNSFKNNFTQYIQSEGVDPTDKRIDWGLDEEPLLTRQQKILNSIAKIHKETSSKTEEKVKSKIEELVSQERKKAGLDSVDITTGVAAPVGMNSAQLKTKMSSREGIKELIKEGMADKIFSDWKAGKFK